MIENMDLNNSAKYQVADYKIPDNFVRELSDNMKLYPCSFDPRNYIAVIYDEEKGKYLCYLPNEAKKMWFHCYCSERRLAGSLLTDYEELSFDIQNNHNQKIGFVIGTAQVIVDGRVIGNCKASQSFSLESVAELDNVIQSACGLALSKALSNAGFGCVSTTAMEKLEVESDTNLVPGEAKESNTHSKGRRGRPRKEASTESSSVDAVVQNGNTDAISFNLSEPPKEVLEEPSMKPSASVGAVLDEAPTDVVSSNSSSRKEDSGASQDDLDAPVEDKTETSVNVTDPVVAAKNTVWTARGLNQGKTLGMILATSPRQIISITKSTSASPEIKAAAELLLPEANKALGLRQ